MIYKKVSRNELLKALEAHARIVNDNDEIFWDKNLKYYVMRTRGATVFIDKFDINEALPDMITMYQRMNFEVLKSPIDIMIGAIKSTDWLVEIPEEGEQ